MRKPACLRAVAVAHLTASAFGQSLVEPERAAALARVFDAPASALQLRCQITSVRPALSFAFHFETGYTIDVPFSQFRGAGHRLTVYTRVTPEGLAPVYMTATEGLPDVAPANADVESTGRFVVGEGSYGVEVLAEDDEHRVCRGSWQIQARRAGSERQLAVTTRPGGVVEMDSADPPVPEPVGLSIGRLTILVHAAPLSPRLSKLQPDDVQRTADSLSSLLRQLPARSVRMIAFNLDQRAVVLRKDGFSTKQVSELVDALNQLELARVDYRTLQNAASPIDLVAGLVQAEFQEKEPPDAVIVLGPQTQVRDDLPSQARDRTKTSPIFYLQFQSALSLPRQMIVSADRPGRGFPRNPEIDGAPLPVGIADSIQQLMTRLKGETVPIRTPHDLADAIRRIDSRVVKTAVSAPAAGKVEAPPGKPVTRAEPAAAEGRPGPDRVAAVDGDPTEVLMRLRDQVLEHGTQIPNHTCVETVERERYDRRGDPSTKSCDAILARRQLASFPDQLRLSTTDRLRLDVAFAGDREIYSWAGASKFHEGEIDELIPEGAMGTGPFAAFLLSVFLDRAPRFVFEGDKMLGRRAVFEYSFRVPREDSHYRHKAGKQWLIVGYSGRLLMDPRTAELARLTVRTEELPPETHTCEVDTVLDYGRVRLNGFDFLLPKSTGQRFIGRDGSEAENSYAFSDCRDFRAESNVVFDGSPSAGSGETASPLPQWAAGLPVTIELASTIDSGQAAAGDRIEGRLALALRDEKGRTLAPQGAKVAGRLMRVEVRHASPPQVTIALRWETVELDGSAVPLSLTPNRATMPGVHAGGLAGLAGLKRRGMEIELPLPGEERCAVIHFPGKRQLVNTALRTEWLTAKP